MGTVTPITVLGEQIAGQSKQARKKLEGLIKGLNSNTFEIGRLLHTIKSNGYYDGYTTFRDYVATLDIKPRVAQYMRRIAEVMEYLSIPPEMYEPIGIGKLREIASLDYQGDWTDTEGTTHMIAAFILDLVKKAHTMTLAEVQSHVRVLKGIPPDEEIVGRHYYLPRLAAEQVVDPAIELARKQIGSTHKDDEGISQDAGDGACLEIVSISFLNDPANQILAYEQERAEWKLEDVLGELGDIEYDGD